MQIKMNVQEKQDDVLHISRCDFVKAQTKPSVLPLQR